MKRSRFHILIVEDDATQGRAVEEVLKRAGYQVTLVNSSAQGLLTVQRQEIHGLVIDCMLPKMNGVDLAEEIQNVSPLKPKTFLYSGIFKDKAFIKEACERTNALAFLSKPFDLQELVDLIDQSFHQDSEDLAPSILSLYGQADLSDGELVRLMEDDSTIHAFHLPALLQHMHKTQLTGDLTLITAEGDLNTITCYQGRICAVRTPDKDTYFGGIAVGFGFVSPEDVMLALSNPERKMIGEKLIASMALSPHAINVILEEQLALRLSQLVKDNVVSLQWSHRKVSTPDYVLKPERIDGLINDWLDSRIDTDWIESVFSLWSHAKLSGRFHMTITNAETFAELISSPEFKPLSDMRFFFEQLVKREAFVRIEEAEDSQDYHFLEARLDRLLSDYKEQNYYQVLGLAEKAKTHEINRAFDELKLYFDPANLKSNCPPSALVKCTQVFNHIEIAHKTLCDDVARANYLLLLQNKRAQKLLEAEPLFRSAIHELVNGYPEPAAEKFQKLMDMKLDFKDLRAYRLWAGLKLDRRFIGVGLEQIPPEERHSPVYMMAKGVSLRYKGQFSKAMEAFRTAHALDPRMGAAKQEMKKVIAQLEKKKGQNKDLLKEVTSVMENFFGKTRRGA